LRKNNLSKAWLAEQMGVSAQHVGKLLKGRSNMTLETVTKFEDATGLVLLVVPQAPAKPKKALSRKKTVFTGSVKFIAAYTTVAPKQQLQTCA
jgi:transcriptional regulator with XRE-family HTH domain